MHSDGARTCAGDLRVLHVLGEFTYGTASAVAEIVPQLEQQGATVSVLILSDVRSDVSSARQRLDETGVSFREISITRIRRWMHPKVLFRIGDIVRIARRLADAEADIIHCHGSLSLAAILLGRNRARVVSTFHGMTNRRSVSQRGYRAAMGLADTVIVLKGQDLRAIQRFPWSARVYLARNGVNVPRWQQKLATSEGLRGVLEIPRDAFVVGLLGRLSKEKGIAPFLLAAGRSGWLVRANAHVVVAGDGPEGERLKRLIEQQALAERVHFLGYRNDLEDVYRTLDALAVPSDTESQPMVVLEAMACRVPVVAFSVGALPEMLEEGAGIPVPSGDYCALIDALDRLRVSSAMQSGLVETAYRQVSEKYAACTVARDLMQNVYLPLISHQRGSNAG